MGQDPTADRTEGVVAQAISGFAAAEGALLPILQAIQQELGWVPASAVPQVAEALNLSRADVHGVLTFYHDLREAPPARRIVRMCRAEACQARGAEAAIAQAQAALGVVMDQAASGDDVALEAVYCLGLCANGPAALYEGRPYAQLQGPRLDKFLKLVG